MILLILLKSFLALVSALAGAGFTFIFKLNHIKLCILISLSAGALLGAAVFTLIPESSAQLGFVELVVSLASGYLLFWVIADTMHIFVLPVLLHILMNKPPKNFQKYFLHCSPLLHFILCLMELQSQPVIFRIMTNRVRFFLL